MKSKIEEILYKYSERVGLYEGGVITCVDENEFDEIAEEVVKLFAIHIVSKSFTAEEVVNELEDCDTLDDAIMFFKEQM